MTTEDLIRQMPLLDLSKVKALSNGGVISIQDGLDKISGYSKFKILKGLSDQPDSVGFGLTNLNKWLASVAPHSDEIKIYFAVDANSKLTMVLWPYSGGKPAQAADSRGMTTVVDPYNIGNRQP